MTELNLLPPQEKELLNLEKTRRWVSFYGAGFLIVVLGFAILLGFVWFFILIQLKSYALTAQNIKASFQGQGVDKEKQLVGELNQYLEKVGQIQKNHKYFSPVLIEIANITPAGVRIEGLSIDEKGRVEITGFAPMRTQVLMLQEALVKSKLFAGIENPLANLTKQTNINFNFKFGLKPEELVK
ncbi:MAG: PilN domain-containing protein [Candidatus Portnoybacteria bacterium]|nr:PilN domain-containing protein [Candidatus Portnoybacteria bacterium]MDD4982749.1 PilN domain-containing protein [Candidatus Portnoybacteria bacterium]